MPEVNFFIDILKQLGVAGVVFVIFYIYHKSQVKLFSEIIETQNEHAKRNFEILQSFIQTLEYHGACLARMETKIDQNQFCPVARKESGK
jgi:ABC-type long-subunit fatty acid transport system fused permease/ATPase subunit